MRLTCNRQRDVIALDTERIHYNVLVRFYVYVYVYKGITSERDFKLEIYSATRSLIPPPSSGEH